MPSQIVGSWFPSGYHGHFRNKSRNDFVCEYRILAKPQPPEKFLRRSMVPRSNNVFSHHDNRHSFMNDAMIFEQWCLRVFFTSTILNRSLDGLLTSYTEEDLTIIPPNCVVVEFFRQQGLGRKRIKNSTYAFKENFITWMPEKQYVERMRPLLSTYTNDFEHVYNPVYKQQQIVDRPKTSFDGTPTTTYRYSHCNGSPNQNTINAMNNEALKLSTYTRTRERVKSAPRVRETVASCLSWYRPKPPSSLKPQINSNETDVPNDVPSLNLPSPEQSPVSETQVVASSE
ncbi:hypothetical protein LOTGIDRAFT_173558 [Lottia gigantea]|uniref:Uncharacterized protein n=1 Tax=Lottia gigantea TaxID=225164 RepID=V4AXE8_LOTGI|nr:hypothetical protein LOTGIDRAFT_173558 [Lottia gigantea]ESO99720.1 hypothetical protein LOTGIDRAFT_173558 [Lottia gigantea]